MSLQHRMSCLSREQLIALHGDLVNAGLAFETKGDYRAIFAKGRKESKGKLKDIYAGLYKAKRENINSMIGALIRLLPNGCAIPIHINHETQE